MSSNSKDSPNSFYHDYFNDDDFYYSISTYIKWLLLLSYINSKDSLDSFYHEYFDDDDFYYLISTNQPPLTVNFTLALLSLITKPTFNSILTGPSMR